MYRAECPDCGKAVELRQGPLEQIVSCPQCNTCLTIPPDLSQVNTILPPSGNDKKRNTVPWRYIIIGFVLPLSLFLSGSVFAEQILHFTGDFFLPWGVIFFAVLYICSFLIYPFYVLQRTKQTLGIKMSPWSVGREFCISLFYLVFVYLVFCMLFYLLTHLFKFEVPVSWERTWFQKTGQEGWKLVLFIAAIFLAPIAEEIYFRGFLYKTLKTRIHVFWAMLVQAAFFALLHLHNITGSILIFVTGILLAMIYERRKTIYAPIFVHCLINTTALLPLLVLAFLNTHEPAQTWDQAEQLPQWLSVTPPAYVQKQETAEDQRLYAIETWGSQGWHLWKKEANAFRAVEYWFPEETEQCAMARLGSIEIYFTYLQDYRRAVIEAENLLVMYPQHQEICARALLDKAWAYYYLDYIDESRDTLEYMFAQYPDFEYETEGARELLEILSQPEYNLEE